MQTTVSGISYIKRKNLTSIYMNHTAKWLSQKEKKSHTQWSLQKDPTGL